MLKEVTPRSYISSLGGDVLVPLFAVVSHYYAAAYINGDDVITYCLDHSL